MELNNTGRLPVPAAVVWLIAFLTVKELIGKHNLRAVVRHVWYHIVLPVVYTHCIQSKLVIPPH